MLEDLGMGSAKESVLTLKNFGICLTRKGHFNEAVALLIKAERVAEQELEEDRTWKVWIKTSMAILNDKMENPDHAKAVMREGLLMANRLGLPIEKMGNKDEIQKFMIRYQKTFPEEDFERK